MNGFKNILYFATVIMMAGCKTAIDYVRPEIGTAGNGHTTVAATYPFGAVQAGPDTGRGTWEHCSGYRFEDTEIYGFTQTHLSGTGCMDLGDIRLQPGGVDRAYAFDKASEVIRCGYYAVTLKDVDVRVEVTAGAYTAYYRFTFNGEAPARLLVDTQWLLTTPDFYEKAVLESSSEIDPRNRVLYGRRKTKAWAEREIDWAVRTGRDWTFEKLPKVAEGERGERIVLTFPDVKRGDAIEVKVDILAPSIRPSEYCCHMKTHEADFDSARAKNEEAWERELSVVKAKGSEEELISFYTSLYHLCVQPNNIALPGESPYYSTFSTWDTFRATHPLYTILYSELAASFVDSMLADAEHHGFTPIWTLWGYDTGCMIGTHSVPIIVDAYLKGVWRGDVERAYKLLKSSVTEEHGRAKAQFELLDSYGYYPFDLVPSESVSRTLECAYDDYCFAKLARALGKEADARRFAQRGEAWRKVFDPTTKLMRGRDSAGAWREPFDPYSLGHEEAAPNDFTEGNSLQYSWHVMQNPEGLIEAMGGRDEFVARLERLFSLPSQVEGAGNLADVTGLIGQYAHGNEPSHHVIYFFAKAGRPDLTAKYVREVFDRFYLPKADGLCGNDDCGQMSAWYLFSAMGLYPFDPCGGEYVLGAPQLKEVVLHPPTSNSHSNSFTIRAENLSRENKYVKRVTLNGVPLTTGIINHSDILAGGELVFEMSNTP